MIYIIEYTLQLGSIKDKKEHGNNDSANIDEQENTKQTRTMAEICTSI